MRPVRSLLFGLALLAGVTALPLAAQQVPCGPRDRVVANLSRVFNETQIGGGLTPKGEFLEVFASPQGTWTVLLSLPQGFSCMIAAGEAWEPGPSPARVPRTGT